MSTIMMRHIYALPLWMVIFLMLALLIVWAILSSAKIRKNELSSMRYYVLSLRRLS